MKCEAFFIRAAQFAGIKLSKHILAGRHGKTRSKTNVKKLPNEISESSNKILPQAKFINSNKEISYKFELASKILSKYPDYDPSWKYRVKDWSAYPHSPSEFRDYGLSTYNYHSDGSGICHASTNRPLFNLKPGYLTFGNSNCSGLRHFQADSA